MKDLLSAVFNIFRYTGKIFGVIRNLIFNLVLLGLVVMLLFSLIPKEITPISANTVLNLNISGKIVEQKKAISSWQKLLNSSSKAAKQSETVLQEVIDIIDTATGDEKITLLRLNLKNLQHGGLNQLQSIGAAIERFKRSGKKVIAAEDYFTQSQYYLASYADTVIINPMGGVDLHGFGVYRLYFRQALEKLQVTYNIFKVGSFKSALEPFIRDDMSPEDRLQNEVWLSSLWQIFVSDINRQRGLDKSIIQSYTTNTADQLRTTGGNSAQLALKVGLVDRILTRPQLAKFIKNAAGDDGSVHYISSYDYKNSVEGSYSSDIDGGKVDKIGIIVAEGNILPGTQPTGVIGGDSLGKLLKKARLDKSVKAVVLRINSGGGSAFASEIIRQQVLALKKSGKPLVVSMGSVAASGGYWIAADADEIWASPATITGSIGIFGAIPTFEKTLAAYGVFSDGIGTTPLASGLDLTQALPDQLKSVIQQSVSYGYNQFLGIVTEGRKLERSHVEKIAQGRVFDGMMAKSLGLVDKLGSLDDAVKAAASLASLSEFQAEYIEQPLTVRDQVFQYLATQLKNIGINILPEITNPILMQLGESLYSRLENLLQMQDPRGIYAYSLSTMAL